MTTNKDWIHWILPDQPETDDYVCYIVRVPNKPAYISAFFGAWHKLTQWLSWEKRGDTSAAIAAEQFRRFEPLPLACDIADEIDETGNMTITVNVNLESNCNCGDTTINLPELTLPDGTTIETVCLPVDPNNPTNEPVENPFDDATETAPPGWPDYPTFTDARCDLAAYVVDSFVDFVEDSDRIEREISAGAVIFDIASILLLLVPVPIGKLKGLVTFAKYVSAFAGILLQVASNLEAVNDWLQMAADKIRENRTELICAIYNANNEPEIRQFVDVVMTQIFDDVPIFVNLPDGIQNQLENWLKPIAADFAVSVSSYLLAQEIPTAYVGNFDCATCGESEIHIQSRNNANQIIETYPMAIGVSVWVTQLKYDSYGPFGEYKFVTNAGNDVHVDSDQFAIVELDGWIQHNITQHPFTVRLANSDGTASYGQIAINQPIPLPTVLNKQGSQYGLIVVAGAGAGNTSGVFRVKIKRLF
jgi:hypothetical protein